MSENTLEFTGERFTPECVREIRYEHWARYAFALELARGKRVLDAACGEGYGSAMLAGAAASVLGVDIAADAIAHAR
ncbi:MAG TPA: SAM-dependent methyltransferase, partial [Rudaea sp.]|nr:SAM-dependent methyltransferase [Rudaea sp.]